MICRTTGDNIDLVEGIEILGGPREFFKRNTLLVTRNTLAHRVTNGFRLFMNFLEHEMLIAALFCCLSIPCDFKYLLGNGLALAISDLDTVLAYNGKFAVPHDVGTACTGDNRGDIRGDIVLPFAEANDQRVVLLCADKHIRVFTAHKCQSIRPFDTTQNLANSCNEIALIYVLQKMNNYFCIRFGLKYMTFFDELFLQ